MNNRIKELVGQAKFMAEENINRQISKNAELDAFAEKFAELIIQECIDMMEQAQDDSYHCFEPSERPTEYIEWLHDWQHRFKQHFGVEE